MDTAFRSLSKMIKAHMHRYSEKYLLYKFHLLFFFFCQPRHIQPDRTSTDVFSTDAFQ